ncbi:substrate-binding domain-containing protein [Nocardioides sp. zg-579]|uniref:Substrate-binding domain-containing protein n=1 Tax=Nocardioides marmotae TaxID=2663857 RepID=A0A6I3ITC2_9ACTN|nr:sugar ABC transporter substrate-binding protein [Nocardioides marmotae]MCR6030142.1 substrate-binding domain-containing protein [Gordonia jinghuaiqii]MTB93773.1 substrate-binding domain-containing protein [Nocardioides marmotae]QKE00110.1 sugar ABC transporter substrate-binding protein [Nocardioides marmotae]
MNRTIRLTAVALAATLSLVGCSMGDDSTPNSSEQDKDNSSAAAEGEPVEDLSVGFVAVNLNSPSINGIKDQFVEAAEEKGWTVEVFDGQGDQAATNNAASDLISRGVDVIVNNSSPNAQMTGVMKEAEAADIPFVSIYGGFVEGVDAEIGTNEFINSALMTAEMVNRLEGKGRIVKLNWTVLQALRDRDAGFKAVVSENPDIEVVREIEVKVPGQVEDSYDQLTNILQSDKDIDAVWLGWDELAPSAVRAIQEAGLEDKVFAVGFDGNSFAWDLIREGSPYVMEPANPFPLMGAKAVETIETIVGGGTLPSKVVYMKPCLINETTVPAEGEEPDWENCAFFPGDI